jgi:hypothetical protein
VRGPVSESHYPRSPPCKIESLFHERCEGFSRVLEFSIGAIKASQQANESRVREAVQLSFGEYRDAF